jgi:glycosyltransferase involved in cell wall biosynthesis
MKRVARRRVLLVQPSMQPPGGGNGVAAWILQALVADHDVTVLSWWPVDVNPINRFFGTTLRRGDFHTLVVPSQWRFIPDHLPVPASLLRSALLMRYTRRVSRDFDVIVGVHNETDYGRRGIQYVHYPTYLRPRPDVDYRWYHRWTPLLESYYQLADRVGGFSFERLKDNLTLANSDWTASQVKRLLGIDAQTLYPPVADPGVGWPWSERRTAFLSLGRISPEKEYERSMRILARVRERVPELTFTIAGTWDRHARRYFDRLERQAAAFGSWIQFRQNPSRQELRGLFASHRYGIHAMREEHFGMAPAEMVRAGMVVWVPRGGGQMEIVGDEPALLFDTEEEAAEKILGVLLDPAQQSRIRDHLARQAEGFGADRFMNEVRAIVANFRE